MKSVILKIKNIDKLAFLAVLFLSVFLAKQLSDYRQRIFFGGGFNLKCDQLEAALPDSPHWRALKGWQQDKHNFFLSAVKYQQNSPVALIKLTYNLNKVQFSPELFAKKIQGSASIDSEGVKQANGLKFAFVSFVPADLDQSSRFQNSVYGVYGFCTLENGRGVEIQIDTVDSVEYAQKLFDGLIKTIHYNNDGLWQAGENVTQAIKDKGVNPAKTRQSDYKYSFIVDDKDNQRVGFRAEFTRHSTSKCHDGLNLTAFDYLQLASTQFTQNDSLDFSKDLSCYCLKSRIESTTYRQPKITELDFADGYLNITDLDDYNKSISVFNWSIPHHLYIELAVEFALGMYNQIKVDLIDSQGKIIPTLLTKQSLASGQGTDFVVSFKSLDDNDGLEQVYISSQGIFLGFKSVSENLSLQNSSKEEIFDSYPVWQSWLDKLDSNN